MERRLAAVMIADVADCELLGDVRNPISWHLCSCQGDTEPLRQRFSAPRSAR